MGLMGLVLTTNEGDTDDDLEDDTYMEENEKTPTNAAPGPSTGPSKKRGRMAVGAVLKRFSRFLLSKLARQERCYDYFYG
jgi:hypothetical protein